MRQGQFPKKNRGRNRRPSNSGSRVYESSGPDVKIRGNAPHVSEKYLALARDAQAAGDPIAAENYNQHAEHYIRIIAASQAQQPTQTETPEPEAEASGGGRGNGASRSRGRSNRANGDGRKNESEAVTEDEVAVKPAVDAVSEKTDQPDDGDEAVVAVASGEPEKPDESAEEAV